MNVAFSELTTITDFVRYVSAAERIFERSAKPVFMGSGAEDLLALCVRNGEDFGLFDPDTSEPALTVIQEGIWNALIRNPDYLARNKDRWRRPAPDAADESNSALGCPPILWTSLWSRGVG